MDWPLLLLVFVSVSGPRRPDYDTGHVIPLNNHGDAHYVTVQQDSRIQKMEALASALFILGFLLNELIVRPSKPNPGKSACTRWCYILVRERKMAP